MRKFCGLVVLAALAAGPALAAPNGVPAGAAAPQWRVVPTATGAAYGNLAAVSCPATGVCVAVGTQDAGSAPHGNRLIERWNGQKWVAQLSPVPAGAQSSSLSAVKCASPTSCIAVGQYTTSTVTKTMAVRWSNNRWTLMATPNPSNSAVNVLSGVACSSATSCFAVGSSFVVPDPTTSETLTLVERWDGAHWTIVPSPNVTDAFDSALADAACASATDCFAVGTSHTELRADTLTEHWDGAAWSIVSSPDPANSADNELNAVTCPSSAGCLAVGTSEHGTLAERWNGSSWTIVASKNPTGSTGAALASISCPAVTRCTAVGTVFMKNQGQRLVEVFTPGGASIVTVPVPSGTKFSALSGVSCAATTSCFAVGNYRLGQNRRPLLLRYS
jgi:hypothetical protein